MSDLLRQYIMEVVSEVQDFRVPNQLIPRGSKKKEEDTDKEEEIDEVNVAANVAGFTGPLGASAADMGADPVKPGGKLKKNKKNFIRWK